MLGHERGFNTYAFSEAATATNNGERGLHMKGKLGHVDRLAFLP